jgi:hypothetical protein
MTYTFSRKMEKQPLGLVGSTVFGRYPKISLEQTMNMIISDGFLVPYAGYEKTSELSDNGEGRGIFTSTITNLLYVVSDNNFYSIDVDNNPTKIGVLDTFTGDVYIDENKGGQIAICDLKNIYIYNYIANTFIKITVDFVPGWIVYHNTYFISVDLITGTWRLSAQSDGTTWPEISVAPFQLAADNALAVVPLPGKGNFVNVMGNIITASWFNTGAQLFPYQENTYNNIDYGVLSVATLAWNETVAVWLAKNKKTGPVIMMTQGGDPVTLSNDGINFKLAELQFPESSYGFFFKQDGHLLYQITFVKDNFSYVYDFNTQKFFNVSDHNMNFHIAKRVAYFNNNYYFVSFLDGDIYKMSTQITNYDGNPIPRIRVCRHFRMPDASFFFVNNLNFTLEQGQSSFPQRIDLSVSKDGGFSFGNTVSKNLNALAKGQNRLIFWRQGRANDFIPQFRFWGEGRFVVGDGEISVYQ